MHSLDLSIHLVFGYGSDHHFDHRLGLSTEIHQSAKSLYLREIGRLGTSLDAADVWGAKIEHGENALIDAHAVGQSHNQQTRAEA